MKDEVFLISEQTIKKVTVINDNVDSAYIHPAIFTAQNVGLCEITGQLLLDKLCSMVADGTISADENVKYKKLLDEYITPYLSYKVCSEITIPLAYKYRNSGIVQTENPYERNSVMKDAQTLKSYYDDKANFFALKIKMYILKNGMAECNDKCDKIANGYATNIVL